MSEIEYKEVPIEAAKEISEKYDKSQVIIASFDKVHGVTHITTYGQSRDDSEQAGNGGNFIKKALGWPDELCHAKPERIESVLEKIGNSVFALETNLVSLDKRIYFKPNWTVEIFQEMYHSIEKIKDLIKE
jgi:hypothetical protein